jgi:class 3 adenylate cyclase
MTLAHGGRGAFIGRRDHLTVLRAALRSAVEGQPRIVFVTGETGIGKSRLVSEFLDSVSSEALTLFGAAPVLVGQEVPFAPIVALLRELRAKLSEDSVREMLPRDSELARLIPDRLIHHRPSLEQVAADISWDRRSRTGLFEQFIALLARLGGDGTRPLVVALEDLHWADSSSLDLLAYVIRNLTEGHVLLVATYRELRHGGDLGAHQRLASEATRHSWVNHIELGPLNEADTRNLVMAAGGGAGSQATRLATIAAKSGGNPLFAEQLVLATSGDEIPHSLADLLEQQVSRLSQQARRVVQIAAVAGVSVPAADLESASAVFGLDVLEAIKETLDSGVLDLRRDGHAVRYVFHHSLMQEVVCADLIPLEQVQLHTVLASVITQHQEGGTADRSRACELARHWSAAGRPGEAYPWLVIAGEAAEDVFAFAEAQASYEAAIEAHPYARQQESGSRRAIGYHFAAGSMEAAAERRGLIERTANAASLAGNPSRALELVESLLDEGRKEDARLLGMRAQFLWELGQPSAALGAYRSAVSALREQTTANAAAVLRAAARTSLLASEFADARDYARLAVQAAQSSGAQSDARQALTTLGAALAHLGDMAGAQHALEEARSAEARQRRQSRLSPRPSRIVDLLVGYWSRSAIMSRLGQPEESAAAAIAGVRRAHELGVDHGWGGLMGVAAAEELIALGRWGEADVLLGDLVEPNGQAAADVHAARAYLHALTGRVADGLGELALAREAPSVHAIGAKAEVLMARADAQLALDANQLSEASRVLAEALVELSPKMELRERADLTALALRVIADRAELAGYLRATSEATELQEAAAQLDGQLVALPFDGDARRIEDRRLDAIGRWGSLEFERAKGHKSADAWVAVAEEWDRLQDPFRGAYARFRAAEAQLARRDLRPAGRQSLVAAHRVALEVGAEPLRRDIEALARRSRVDVRESPRSESAEPAKEVDQTRQRRPDLGLSTRELEVLTLLAEGRTNREIATTLFISEKTAGHHVSNILGKLGVRSRVEAAAMAVRIGLNPGPDAMAVGVDRPADGSSAAERVTTPTMMFTDIVKSTALLEAIGDDAWSSLVRWHDATLTSLFSSYAGRVVDHAGDGFFVEFPDVRAALDCAIAVQRTMADHRLRQGFAPKLRIGVHRAPVSKDGPALRGRGVHEAARIGQAAAADEILVSAVSIKSVELAYSTLEPR